jgi:hypothetical protein
MATPHTINNRPGVFPPYLRTKHPGPMPLSDGLPDSIPGSWTLEEYRANAVRAIEEYHAGLCTDRP